jgi:hypothetical protein
MAGMLQSVEFLEQLCSLIRNMWIFLHKLLTNSKPIMTVNPKTRVQQLQNPPFGSTHDLEIDRKGYSVRETLVGN